MTEAMLYVFDIVGELTATSAPLVDVAPRLSAPDFAQAIHDTAVAVIRGAEAAKEELASMGASGADPTLQRYQAILADVKAILDSRPD